MKRLSIIVALALALTSIAVADITPVGTPVDSGSWYQGFRESGVGPFTLMTFSMVSGGTFGDLGTPTGVNSLAAGWNSSISSGKTFISASGPFSTDMIFNVVFSNASSSTPLSFNFHAYNNGVLVDDALAAWDGANWHITAATPEPASLTLLASGLLGFAFRRKFKK